MRTYIKALLVVCVVLGMQACIRQASAIPAIPSPITLSQPNQTMFKAYLRGDEYRHWMELPSGHTIVRNAKTLEWEYAKLDAKGKLIPSGVYVNPGTPPPSSLPLHLMPPSNRPAALRSINPMSSGPAFGAWPPHFSSGSHNLLIIRAQFTDRSLISTPADTYGAVFDGSPGAKSVANYYKDNSFGLLTVAPATHTEPGNPPGVLTVSVPMAHPNWEADTSNYHRQIYEQQWVNAALAQAANYIDFSSYDTNHDGQIRTTELVVYFIVAGYEQAEGGPAPNIWAHAWPEALGMVFNAGGEQLLAIALGGELHPDNAQEGIGGITHEMGHSMCDLPDLYDTTYFNQGLGYFTLMAGGSWGTSADDAYQGDTPVNLDAWSRQYVGWSTPRTPSVPTLMTFGLPLASRDSTVRLRNPELSANEYFLIENRCPVGWDRGMEIALGDHGWTGGLLILHVDESIGTPINNDLNDYVYGSHQGVMAEEASTSDGSLLDNTSYGSRYHLFWTGNNAQFGRLTTPNSVFYSGAYSYMSVRDVSTPGQSMTATVVPFEATDTPTISPNGGPFNSAQSVTMSCITPGAVIRYTTNGDDPTESSTTYSGPITITASTTVKAKAWRTSLPPSGVAAASFAYRDATVWYVDRNAGGNSHDGHSWATAFTNVQSAISVAASGDDVWVADGVYKEHITLKSGVALYGGFAGGESSSGSRDWTANQTILDGTNTGVVIVVAAGAPAYTRIDGFTIRNGSAMGDGGGIVCQTNSSPTIANNTISLNRSVTGGGGILCRDGSSPTVLSNVFTGNQAYQGGAIACFSSSAPTIMFNTFAGNRAMFENGGAIYCDASSPVIADNLLCGNQASMSGGGIAASASSPVIRDNTIADNTASSGGGGICLLSGSSAQVVNNIIAFNSTGIWSDSSSPVIRKNCVSGNTGAGYIGVTPDSTNISSDPLFADRSNCDYHLKASSPCINVGDDTVIPPGEKDLDGQPRLCGEHVDMGSYEVYSHAPVNVSLSPSSGRLPLGNKLTLTSTYRDAAGYSDMANSYLLINATNDLHNAVYLMYQASDGKLYLRKDDDSGWLTGYAPGSANVVENSQCKLFCADTTVTHSGDTLTVAWKIQLKNPMADKTVHGYMRVVDISGFADDWQTMGTFSTASSPVNVSASPTSGTYACGTKLVFSTSYSDPDGYTDLGTCYSILNPTLSAANSIELIYYQPTNKLYLVSDTGGTWLGGVTPGTSGATIENSRCVVYCGETTTSGSGNDLTVNWKIAFKPTMASKTCGAWLRVTDRLGLVDEWEKQASSISVGGSPSNVSVSPTSGTYASGAKLVFSTSYSDPDGYTDLGTCYSILNPTLSAANSIELIYYQPTNKLYLVSDTGGTWLGGVTPGTSGATIENSRCIVYCGETTVSRSGSNLTVNWKIAFKPTMASKTCGAWLRVTDRLGLVDEWEKQASSISVGGPPSNVSVSPTSGTYASGAKLVFSTSYSDPDGYTDLGTCYSIVNPTLSAANSIELIYYQPTNKLYLQNDAGSAWLGGVTPGTAGATIENSRCIVYCEETTVSGSGNGLTVNWKIAFKPTMASKTCGAWLRVTDRGGLVDEWEKRASSISVGGPPSNVSVSPTSGTYASGAKLVFSTSYSDPDGYTDLGTCYSIVNPTLSAANSIELIYYQPTNKLYLQNDAGNAWLGGVIPGTAGATIENSRCVVYCGETTVNGSGNNLTVNWKIAPKSLMAGKTCGAWLRVNDRLGLVDEWESMGASVSVSAQP